jgi:D-alanine-D-alanine ligase
LKIIVLMGGTSAEREISLTSGVGVVEALSKRGHQVTALDTAGEMRKLDIKDKKLLEIKETPPDTKKLAEIGEFFSVQRFKAEDLSGTEVIFLALHGGRGEDGTIQALLELTGIPYCGSGVLGSAVAMDKEIAKVIFKANNIPTPDWISVDAKNLPQENDLTGEVEGRLGFPVVVKPNNQGSTVGLSFVEKKQELLSAVREAARFSNRVLLERYIPGRELTVGILGEEALPVAEIIPEHGIYDYECKYTPGKSQYIVPAELPEAKGVELQRLGLRAFQALRCADFGRVDFRMDEKGDFFCLEVNTLPGMTPTSLVPKAAKAIGISFERLVERICLLAIERKKRDAQKA